MENNFDIRVHFMNFSTLNCRGSTRLLYVYLHVDNYEGNFFPRVKRIISSNRKYLLVGKPAIFYQHLCHQTKRKYIGIENVYLYTIRIPYDCF